MGVVRSALAKVEAAAADKPDKILAGFSGGRPLADLFSAGYRMVASTADMVLLRQGALADVAAGQSAAAAAAVAAATSQGETIERREQEGGKKEKKRKKRKRDG